MAKEMTTPELKKYLFSNEATVMLRLSSLRVIYPSLRDDELLAYMYLEQLEKVEGKD